MHRVAEVHVSIYRFTLGFLSEMMVVVAQCMEMGDKNNFLGESILTGVAI